MPKVKIGDFGVSKRATDQVQTTMVTTVGTGGYTAPEVLKQGSWSKSYLPNVDLWSLGCILYRMLKGAALFTSHSDTLDNSVQKIASLPQQLGSFDGDVLAFVRNLICMDTKRRYDAYEALGDPWLTGQTERASKRPRA